MCLNLSIADTVAGISKYCFIFLSSFVHHENNKINRKEEKGKEKENIERKWVTWNEIWVILIYIIKKIGLLEIFMSNGWYLSSYFILMAFSSELPVVCIIT